MRSGLMLMMGVLGALVILIVLFPATQPSAPLQAKSANAEPQLAATEHTRRLATDEVSPPARLEDVSWLVGAWEGEAFGGTFEEVWNPPSKGTMVGFFKLMGESEIQFYELLVLEEAGQSLVMKVKHFSADFTAWEEKSDHITFRLVAIEKDVIHFSGISFYRQNNGDIIAYIAMRSDGQVREEKLIYYRRQL